MAAAGSAPLVSVLVTSYNHARYVEEALDSLRHQTSGEFEVIITDDASTDGSADVIAAWLARTGYPAQLIRNPVNRGICANRNAALARASGAFVCSLSGDDSYEPDRIGRQLECFLKQPERVAAVYSDMLVVDADGKPKARSFLTRTLNGAPPPQGELFSCILAGNFLPAPAVMVRRSAIDAVGGYDESLVYEDLDMWLRLSFRFGFVYLPGLLVRYRMHANSMSSSRSIRPRLHRSYSRILAKWINAGLDGGDASPGARCFIAQRSFVALPQGHRGSARCLPLRSGAGAAAAAAPARASRHVAGGRCHSAMVVAVLSHLSPSRPMAVAPGQARSAASRALSLGATKSRNARTFSGS